MFVGIALAIFSAILRNIGLSLQKLAHLREHTRLQEEATFGTRVSLSNSTTSCFQRPLWLTGLVLMVGSGIGDFLSLGFAPQSIIAPLSSFTLVANVFLAPIILKESVTKRDYISTLIIGAGCSLTVVFASHAESDYSVDSLFELFTAAGFFVYMLAVGLSFVALFITNSRFDVVRRTDSSLYEQRYKAIHRITAPAMAGLAGSQNVLFAKSASQLMIFLAEGKTEVFARYETYLVFIVFLLAIVFEVKWLNEALMRFDATFVVPVFQILWIAVSVGGGLVVYQEYKGMGLDQVFAFAAGILLTIIGVVILSIPRISKEELEAMANAGSSDGDIEAHKLDGPHGNLDNLDIPSPLSSNNRVNKNSMWNTPRSARSRQPSRFRAVSFAAVGMPSIVANDDIQYGFKYASADYI